MPQGIPPATTRQHDNVATATPGELKFLDMWTPLFSTDAFGGITSLNDKKQRQTSTLPCNNGVVLQATTNSRREGIAKVAPLMM